MSAPTNFGKVIARQFEVYQEMSDKVAGRRKLAGEAARAKARADGLDPSKPEDATKIKSIGEKARNKHLPVRQWRYQHQQTCRNADCLGLIVWYSYELNETRSNLPDNRFKICSACTARTFSKIHSSGGLTQ